MKTLIIYTLLVFMTLFYLEQIKDFTLDDLGIYLDTRHLRKRKKEPLSKRVSEIKGK